MQQQQLPSDPIWQNQDLGPNSTSIVFVSTDYNLAENLTDLLQRLAQIEKETTCAISIHGQWIKIKNNSAEIRKQAFNLIQTATKKSCKEIFLPSVNEDNQLRLSSPSPPPLDDPTKSTAQINESPRYRKNGLTRSSTETQISSLQKAKHFSPFSVLLPLTTETVMNEIASPLSPVKLLKDKVILEEVTTIKETVENTDQNAASKRYSKDFLLLRADVPASKKLPVNWNSLNEIFPSICFCGKVLSYFNPYKYHEHWEKTKKQNYELHDSNESPRNEFYKRQNNVDFKAHTDDYLNLSLRDFNHTSNNYHTRSFRINNYFNNEHVGNKKYSGYDGFNGFSSNRKQHQLGLEIRQNQFQQNQVFYLQEHQLKRMHKQGKFHLNNPSSQNVFD